MNLKFVLINYHKLLKLLVVTIFSFNYSSYGADYNKKIKFGDSEVIGSNFSEPPPSKDKTPPTTQQNTPGSFDPVSTYKKYNPQPGTQTGDMVAGTNRSCEEVPEFNENEYNRDLIGKPGPPFVAVNIRKSFKTAHPDTYRYLCEECSQSGINSHFADFNNINQNQTSGSQAGSDASKLAAQAKIIANKDSLTCGYLKEKLNKHYNQTYQAIEKDREICLTVSKSIYDSQVAAKNADAGYNYNKNRDTCEGLGKHFKTKTQRVLAFMKKHWMLISGILAAAGTGAYFLMKSGKKQADEIKTNPDDTEKKDDIVKNQDNDDTDKNKEEDIATTTNQFKDPSNEDYCKHATKPLECFVTPGCDLACVSNQYGVSDYKGYLYDTTRISPQGQVVDMSSIGNKNNVANNSNSSSGGNGSSSSNGLDLIGGGSNETGDTDKSKRPAPRGANDDEGYTGRRGSSYGSDSFDDDRTPASQKARNKGLGENGGQQVKLTPEQSGPILPKESNMFTRISEVARVQCVRDLAICDK